MESIEKNANIYEGGDDDISSKVAIDAIDTH